LNDAEQENKNLTEKEIVELLNVKIDKKVSSFLSTLSSDNVKLEEISEAMVNFIPVSLKEGFHFNSKTVNTSATPVGVRLPLDSSKESELPYITVREIVNDKNIGINSLDYSSGAKSSPMLNATASLEYLKLVDTDENGKVVGVEKTKDSTNKKKSFSILIGKLVNNLSKLDVSLSIDDEFPLKGPKKEMYKNFSAYVTKNFSAADKLMRMILSHKPQLPSILSKEVESLLAGESSLGLESKVCKNLKSLLFPLSESDVFGNYISVTPLHSMPFNEMMMDSIWNMRKTMSKNGSEEDKRNLLLNANIDEGLIDDIISKKVNTVYPKDIMSSIPVGGAQPQNATAIMPSKYNGTGKVFINRPPFSDKQIKRLYAIAHKGYTLNNHVAELVSTLSEKMHMDYVKLDGESYKIKGTSGDAIKKISMPHIKKIASLIKSSINNDLDRILNADIDLSDVSEHAKMSWNPSLRNELWYEKLATNIVSISYLGKEPLKTEGITNSMRKFIKKELVKEMSE